MMLYMMPATKYSFISKTCKHLLSCSAAQKYLKLRRATNMAGQLQYLVRREGNKVAFRKTFGSKSPGVIFFPGFMSNMNGGKALALEKYCQHYGHTYVRFDYQGCGESIGDLPPDEKYFDVWKSDAQAVLDELTSGPQVLVGSSMGAAVMLLLALDNPSRIQALLGVATAVSFKKPLTYTEESDIEKNQSNAPETRYVTPENFIHKEYQRCLMSESIPIKKPVCLIHGMQDDTVPYTTSVDLSKRLLSDHVDVILRKQGQHRMSTDEDLDLLVKCLDNLILLTSRGKS